MYRLSCRAGITCLCGWVGCLLLLLAPLSQAQEKAYGKSEAPVAAEAFGVQIRTSNPDEMAYVIKQSLLFNYAKEHSLKATQQEVERFLARKQQADAAARKQAEARRVEVQQALQSKTLTDAKRKQLTGELKFLDGMHKASLEADKQAGDPKITAAREQMARAIIGQWKVNRALYQKYGGRVVYQQGGAEPLDAQRDYFKAVQKAGDLKILNKGFEADFWAYYTNDSKYHFYPQNEKDSAINTPWWLMEPKSGR